MVDAGRVQRLRRQGSARDLDQQAGQAGIGVVDRRCDPGKGGYPRAPLPALEATKTPGGESGTRGDVALGEATLLPQRHQQ